MSMKIWWQDIFPDAEKMKKDFGFDVKDMKEKAYVNLLKVVKKTARPDTEIEIHFNKYSSYMVESSYMELLNNVWIVEGIIEAEKQGYDAAIIGCGNDPALHQARQAVDIPVIGPAEAAMLISCTLGHKFSVITVLKQLIPVCERNIRQYGLESRVAGPVKQYYLGGNPMQALLDMLLQPEKINPQFEEVCNLCVEDGAEVIIPACCSLSPATSLANYKEVPGKRVPIVDITQAAVKMAELLVDMKRTIGLGKSQRNWYRSMKPEMRDRFMGFAMKN